MKQIIITSALALAYLAGTAALAATGFKIGQYQAAQQIARLEDSKK